MRDYNPNSGVDLPWFETSEISKLDSIPAKYKAAAESLHYKGYCNWFIVRNWPDCKQ